MAINLRPHYMSREWYLLSFSEEEREAVKLVKLFRESINFIRSRTDLKLVLRVGEFTRLFVAFAEKMGKTGHLYSTGEDGQCPAVIMADKSIDHVDSSTEGNLVAYVFNNNPPSLFGRPDFHILKSSEDFEKMVEITEGLLLGA